MIGAEAGVASALAMVREVAPGDSRLLCYYVPTPGATPDEPRIRAALRRVLPQNMMPSALVALPRVPAHARTARSTGRRCPLPRVSLQRTADYKPPRTTIEHELVQIWEKLLDRRPIGVREDFFEIGGHSLLAVRMLAEIARVRGRHVPLAWLFESSTIESLGARIGAELQAQAEPPLVVLQAGRGGHAARLRARRRARRGLVLPAPRAARHSRRAAARAADARRRRRGSRVAHRDDGGAPRRRAAEGAAARPVSARRLLRRRHHRVRDGAPAPRGG